MVSDIAASDDPEGHNFDGYDCWCCPTFSDTDGNELTRDQAEASEEPVVVIHRSERRGINGITGDIPWQT